jgi:cellulose synthase/poly-beta-1,6-N-acetylglucosamine synthase-like glycosyltransferase
VSPPHDYAFLLGTVIDRATFAWAHDEAAACGCAIHDVLLAAGAVSQDQYVAALARSLGVPVVAWDAKLDLAGAPPRPTGEIGLPGVWRGRSYRVLDAVGAAPRDVSREVAELRARGFTVALASRRFIDAAVEEHARHRNLEEAVNGLRAERPASSAGALGPAWQPLALTTAGGVIMGGLAVLPDASYAALTALISIPFLCVTLLRLFALHWAVAGSQRRVQIEWTDAPDGPDWQLPSYTVLVPLVREANVLPDLIEALQALDYPSARLEVFLVLEAADAETQAALLGLELPGNFRTLLVPDAMPRTKPKALNYALQFARGDFVVVYDAEDRPEPDQLRRAWHVFRHAPSDLGCLQAQLNIDNPRQSWLTRQFTIEYSALFDAVLPALERLRLPVPLGGTSNHFPRSTLIGVGAWDPYNVTEDADLGVRLARHGYRTGVLASTTWEEAPPALATWFKQRTRWLKGWMQTYLVHTRSLGRLNRELGLRASAGFHTLMGGLVASALAHPIFYALLAWHWWEGGLLAPAESTMGAILLTVVWINLGVGYAASILVGALAVWRRGHRGLVPFALLMPLYWLLISAAAYRALWQLAHDPYLWEKTEHGGAGRR